jgi:chorismate synthase
MGARPAWPLTEADIQPDLDRRRPGTSKFVTQRNEPDTVEILSGVYQG